MNFLTKYSINGTYFRPTNADNIGFKMDWTGDIAEAELTVDSIELETDAKRLVIEHINTYGVFEGLPLTIEVGSLTLDYYIDLTDNPLISGAGDSSIEVTIKRRKAVDYFKEQADGLSFEALNKTNPITLIDVPYLIIKDNQLEMLIMLGISMFTITKALIEGVKELVTIISAGAVASATPSVSIAGPVINIGAIIAYVLRIAAQVIYLAVMTIALIDLTKQLIELIFPPIRKLKAVKVQELFIKGCAKLGYTFSSTILSAMPQLTILPVPLKEEQKSIFTTLFSLNNGSFTKGYPTARDTTPTLGRLVDAMQEMFNASIRVINSVVYLERRDYWVLNSQVQITTTLNLQDKRENQWRYNLGEAWKRYWIHYQLDSNDLNTLDNIDSSQAEYSTEPVMVQNADLVSIKGLADVSIPFAFGIRKGSLSYVEEATLPFAQLADEVVQFFGGSSNLVSQVQGRIGVLQLSQQYFTVSKLMYTIGGKQPSNYLTKIGANVIYQNYHAINQVKTNFKKIYDDPVRFSTFNFEDIIDNNYVTDQDGNSLEILTLEWINEAKEAQITYAEKSNEGDNTKTILISG